MRLADLIGDLGYGLFRVLEVLHRRGLGPRVQEPLKHGEDVGLVLGHVETKHTIKMTGI